MRHFHLILRNDWLWEKEKSKSKHLSYRLAFKLHCFLFVMGYPAFNSLARSARRGCLRLFLSPPLCPGFRVRLPVSSQGSSPRPALTWGAGRLNQLFLGWEQERYRGEESRRDPSGKATADGGKAALSINQATVCGVGLGERQLPLGQSTGQTREARQGGVSETEQDKDRHSRAQTLSWLCTSA